MEIDEREFLESLRKGVSSSYVFLFNRYYSGLVVYAKHLLGAETHAEDIVHDIFTSLWEKRETLDVTISIKSYLFASVRNRCLNHLIHQRVHDEYQEAVLHKGDVSGMLTWDYYVESELSEMIEKAIDKLPLQCRKIFILSRFEEKTAQEIGDDLSISPRTVEKHIEKALRLLRLELQDYLPIGLLVWLIKP